MRLLIAICLAFALPPMAFAEPAASYQALEWDKEMVLAPGWYRAARPIGVSGDITVKTLPGVFIDGVNFQTRGGAQHWEIDGTQMRRVHISGKMSSSGHGVDSGFEECGFDKDDNWFMFWWSTHWRFENCIFTKTVLRGELTPLDIPPTPRAALSTA